MKIVRIVLFILIVIGIGLLATQTLWLEPLTTFILSYEKGSEIIPVETKTSPASSAPTTPVIKTAPTTAAPGEHCGGNMTTALECSVGYHCAPAPGSHLPFGDVGGVCVIN